MTTIQTTIKSKSNKVAGRMMDEAIDAYRTAKANIKAAWDRVSSEDIKEGATWYSVARSWTKEYFRINGLGSLPLAVKLGVVAATSPQTSWPTRNLAVAVQTVKEDKGHYRSVLVKVRAILAGADIPTTLGGAKTQSFWHNLTGNEDHVTIDSHMVWILTGEWPITGDRPSIGGKQDKLSTPKDHVYCALSLAVREHAKETGFTPAQIQAILWIWGRRAFPKPGPHNDDARVNGIIIQEHATDEDTSK